MAGNMAPAQDAATEAEQHWLEAKKITHSMVKKLEQIAKDESGSKKLLADLESVEHLLESLRLACMATTFTDFKFAHTNRVLDRLWHVHTLISAEYKKGLQRHRGHGQIVQFRTIEKQYAKHLKTAQYFYKGFIERLSARYRLRPLQRVAHAMQSGSITMSEVIDADEARLGHELTVACYRTVLHMGDIARYRLNASRQKGHSPDVAMTYYALAQDLMPQEGDAHHQMAVVLADQRRDFDVVYHFLRSWSVQQPFALAPKNLASEFKKLLQPPSASRKQANTPPDPYELFGSWFVRLHAHYFKGEDFSSQKELEGEVLHRWEALLKKAEQPAYLQKAVLLSIASYDIAQKRAKNESTAANTQSRQFILRFMVQTILVLSRVFETEIQRLFEEPSSDDEAAPVPKPKAARAPPANEKNTKSNGRSRANHGGKAADNKQDGAANGMQGSRQACKKSSASDTCLSLFRICMAWIAKHRKDLVAAKDYLAPDVADMHRSIARCLSLFVELISTTDASPVPYLLPEDVEAVGLAPLDDWTALHEAGANTPFKPHYNEEGVERKDATHEILARIYDVVECTVHLVGDPAFPWLLVSAQEDGREVAKIVYAEDHVPSPAVPAAAAAAAATAASPDPAVMAPTASSNNGQGPPRPALRQPEAVQDAPASHAGLPVAGLSGIDSMQQASQPQPQPQPAPRTSISLSYKDLDDEDDDFLPGPMRGQRPMPVGHGTAARASVAPSPFAQAAEQELDFLESAAYRRVENFLSPPELHPHFSQQAAGTAPPSSSYGMHTDTANDVFGRLQTPRVSGAPHFGSVAMNAAKPIPSSPWNNNSNSSSSYISSLGYYPQAASSPSAAPAGFGLSAMETPPPGLPMRPPASIEEQLAFLTLAKQHERQVAAAAAAAAAAATTTTAAVAASPVGPSLLSYGLGSASRGFPSALSPVGAAKRPHSPSGGPVGGPTSGFVNPWNVGANVNGAGAGAMLYSSNFTAMASPLSGLPPVQSPRGLPAAATTSPQQTLHDTYESIYGPPVHSSLLTQQQQQQQSRFQRDRRLSPSNSSSMNSGAFGGFGQYGAGVPGGGTEAGGGSGVNNGAPWPGAATAWGRGPPLTKDDPTHFRNAVRQTGLMEDTNTYDRNALLSALQDNGQPTRPR